MTGPSRRAAVAIALALVMVASGALFIPLAPAHGSAGTAPNSPPSNSGDVPAPGASAQAANAPSQTLSVDGGPVTVGAGAGPVPSSSSAGSPAAKAPSVPRPVRANGSAPDPQGEPTYVVMFSESNLSAGMNWSVEINGSRYYGVAPGGGPDVFGTINVSLPVGTYSYSVFSIDNWELINPPTAPANVTAAGWNSPILIWQLLLEYTATFYEHGLPQGAIWAMIVNGTFQTGIAPSVSPGEIQVQVANGLDSYIIVDVAGWHQISYPYSGSLNASGHPPVSLQIYFNQVIYAASFSESGLAQGVTWSVVINGTTTTGVAPNPISVLLPNTTFTWQVLPLAGWQLTPADASFYAVQTVNMTLVGFTQSIAFAQVTYPVTFTEAGLVSGVHYTIAINGTGYTGIAGTSSATTDLPNGSFTWKVVDVAGWHLTNGLLYSTQLARETSAGFTEPVSFVQMLYAVSFRITGLNGAEAWTITINGSSPNAQTLSGTGSTASASPSFGLPNGTWTYKISPIAGAQTTYSTQTGPAIDGASPSIRTIAFTQVLYPVTITESGLASGVTWSIDVNGSVVMGVAGGLAPTGEVPNGTFTWYVVNVAGWRLSPSQVGYYAPTTESQSAAGFGMAVSFGQVLYAVSFQVTGLNGPQGWTIVVNGSSPNHQSLTGSGDTASVSPPSGLPNGTWTFQVEPIVGWRTTYSVQVGPGINGAPPAIRTISLTQATYSVSLSESGLASGVAWSVLINGTLHSGVAGSTLPTASLPNGTFTWSVSNVPGWRLVNPAYYSTQGASQGSGGFSKAIAFTQTLYSVSFTVTGLNGAESWSIVVNGTSANAQTLRGVGDQASVPLATGLPNGTWTYQVSPLPGWQTAYRSVTGPEIAGDSPAPTTITFLPVLYSVSFSVSGLNGLEPWSITVNGSEQVVGTGNEASVSPMQGLPNGTWTYQISPISGWQTAYSVRNGPAIAGGPPALQSIVFAQATYPVTWTETGLSGETWGVRVNGTTTSAVAPAPVVFTLPNGTFTYAIATVPGWAAGAYSGSVSENSGAQSPDPVPISFSQLVYPVTFAESGLSTGTHWGITVNSTLRLALAPGTIDFSLPNGTLVYTVVGIAGWRAASYTGSFVEAGGVQSPDPVTVSFTPTLYVVAFEESGIVGSAWSVSLNGTSSGPVSGDTFDFDVPNGSYAYEFADVPGWHIETGSYFGNLSVSGGSPTPVSVVFAQVTYSVGFTETTLPGSSEWSVTLNGTLQSTTGTDIVFPNMPNGSYPYYVAAPAGYESDSASGRVVLQGPPAGEISITFVRIPAHAYSVTFQETGLPNGAQWSVTINGTLVSALAGQPITVSFVNGTYSYSVSDAPGWHQLSLPYSGSFTIDGAPFDATPLLFAQALYPVVFSEEGLSSGITWSITVNGTRLSTTIPGTLSIDLPNGSFRYAIGSVPGWSLTSIPYSDPAAGPIDGQPLDYASAVFAQVTYPVTFTVSGFNGGEGWTIFVNQSSENAQTLSGSGDGSATAQLPNGTWTYVVSPVAGWTTPAYASTVGPAIDGSGSGASIAFLPFRYSVGFTASGLTGETWGITVNGTHETRAGSGTLSFELPNGTWSYSLDPVSGWRAGIAYSGGSAGLGPVAGAPISAPFTFQPVRYSVTFSVHGLVGALWSVTFNGTNSGPLSNTSYSFASPNGTYPYSFENVPGWRITSGNYSGEVATAGAAPAPVSVTFSPTTYSVTFRESGLPSGTEWSAELNGTLESSTSSTITFTGVTNGSYAYSIPPVSGYTADPISGTITVAGSSPTQAIAFTVRPPTTYPITFREVGLPSGATWRVTIDGTTYSGAAGTNLTANLVNGTYSYSIVDVAGWHQRTLAYSGSFQIAGGPVNEPILLFDQVTYAVIFPEHGLPTGKVWSIEINGSLFAALAPAPVNTTLPNGTYSWWIGDLSGWHQSTLPYIGSGSVDGRTIDEPTLEFSQVTYAVTFLETGLPAGGTWTVTINGTAMSEPTGSPISTVLPNGTFTFVITGVAGYHQVAVPYSGSGTIDGAAVTEPTLAFAPFTYAVTFSEGGLPSGTMWSVTFGAATVNATGTTIVFDSPNGSYGFQVSAAAYLADPSVGTLSVAGAATGISVDFTLAPPSTYSIAFLEAGLATGAVWSVTLDGNASGANAPTPIEFLGLANGTYSFTAGASGYTVSPEEGNVTVDGSSASVALNFTPIPLRNYSVTFQEAGLPAGGSWTATLGASSMTGTSPTITFTNVSNGTYPFRVGAVGYVSSPSNGTLVVAGANAGVSIVFVEIAYPVTFQETGLPSRLGWTVTVGGTTYRASAGESSINVSLPNATYAFTPSPETPWTPDVYGFAIFTVSGAPLTVPIVYAYGSPVTFVQVGLNDSLTWTVVISNATSGARLTELNVSGPSTEIYLPNGTYTYRIVPPAGYAVSNPTGTLSVSGQPVQRTAYIGPAAPRAGSVSYWWIVLVVVALGAGILAAVVVSRYRRT